MSNSIRSAGKVLGHLTTLGMGKRLSGRALGSDGALRTWEDGRIE